MTNIHDIIKAVRNQTDSIILFHSATGKDSIMLADVCFDHFNNVQLVYMYFVPGLTHIQKYIQYTEIKYNTTFLQVPHYALGSYIKTGYMGIKKDEKQKKYNLSDIAEQVKVKTGIDWVMMGFKMADGLNRRLMLRGYEMNSINQNNKKVYPLSEWKNNQVLQYIENKQLLQPLKYNNLRSQDQDISNIEYLKWLENNYPEDLELTFKYFPSCRQKLYEYRYQETRENALSAI